MTTITTTVRIVPCELCVKGKVEILGEKTACPQCNGRGQIVATSERLLVGLVLRWDVFR